MKKAVRYFHLALHRIPLYAKRYATYIVRAIEKRPLVTFLVALGVLVTLIVLGSFLRQVPPAEKTMTRPTKVVSVYRIGSAPRMTIQAQTKKSGVIQIVALTNGVVDKVHHLEGKDVKKGDLLLSMSTNYQGGNVLSLQRQLAQKQYEGVVKTYPNQKDLIKKQKELARKTDQNADELRAITTRSFEETRSLITLNEDILRTLDENLRTLEQNSVANRELILATKQVKSQFLAATNQARQTLRSNEYQAADDKPPAQMSELQKEIALEQLEIQEKQLNINKEISRIQLLIAQVTEGIMFPVAPFRGTIQRVLVKEKQVVTPGTPLMVLSQVIEEDPITAVAFVSKDIAQRVSRLEPSILHLGNTTYATTPTFVSTEAVEGTLYAIYYPIPDSYNAEVVSEGFITVDMPIGYAETTSIIPFVPLDAIYQTREKAYVFVNENGIAKSREIRLSTVYGRFVEITSGLSQGDAVIMDRSIIEGDFIQTR